MAGWNATEADFLTSDENLAALRAQGQALVALREYYRETAGDRFDAATLARLDFAKWLYQTGHIS